MSESIITRVGDNPELEPYAVRIDQARGKGVAAILEIGECLTEAQRRLSHKGKGIFKAWVEERCGFTFMQASRFMNAQKVFEGSNNVVTNFDDSATYALAAPSCPVQARVDAIDIAEQGERVTHKLAQALIERYKDREPIEEAEAVTGIVADLQTLVERGSEFGTIYADPPWAYDNQGTRAATGNHYESMSVAALCELPVKELAAEQAHLHLWTTNAFLPHAFDIIEAWGFEYKSMFVWCKSQMGLGNYWRVSHETLLLGVKGGLTFPIEGRVKSWIEEPRSPKHSRKPEVVRVLVQNVSPEPRLELFGRRAVPGWMVLGNEVETDLFTQDVPNE